MADVIKMPRLSDTMTEGVIKVWHKKVGDSVKPGDILAEVETDKATMDLEAFQDGVILHIQVDKGAVPVDGIIAIIGKSGEDFSALLENKAINISTASEIKAATPETQVMAASTSTSSIVQDNRVKASPLAKSLAKEQGLDISKVPGTGENGRIIKKDIESALLEVKPMQAVTSQVSSPIEGDIVVELSQMRKTIARRLSDSKFTAPHFYLTTEIDMDECVQTRNSLNQIAPSKISFNDIIVKACAAALRMNPNVNVSWMGDKMIYHSEIHIGVAVAIEDGLVVPVIRNTDKKTLTQIKDEINDKAVRAKSKKLNLDEMQGNTFTISNLGMFDIEHFTAIINPPDAAILAVGSIAKKAVVKNDQLVIGNRMSVTLSCDHRAVDGATGAKFLQSLKQILENPISLIL